MKTTFDIPVATKAECIAESLRRLNVAVRAEETGRAESTVMAGFRMALKVEDAAFDGRA